MFLVSVGGGVGGLAAVLAARYAGALLGYRALHTYITPDERVLHYPLAGTWVRADYLFASAGPESTYLLAASRSDYIGAEYLRICCPVSVIINLSLQASAPFAHPVSCLL